MVERALRQCHTCDQQQPFAPSSHRNPTLHGAVRSSALDPLPDTDFILWLLYLSHASLTYTPASVSGDPSTVNPYAQSYIPESRLVKSFVQNMFARVHSSIHTRVRAWRNSSDVSKFQLRVQIVSAQWVISCALYVHSCSCTRVQYVVSSVSYSKSLLLLVSNRIALSNSASMARYN